MWGSAWQTLNDFVRPMPNTYWRSLGDSHSGLSESGVLSLNGLRPSGDAILPHLSFPGAPYGRQPFSLSSWSTVSLCTRMLRPT